MTCAAHTDSPRGMVFDIQRMSIHDGPGIRTTVFLKGCPLKCPWCHNPEGRDPRPMLAFTPALCIGCGYCFRRCTHGAHVMQEGRHVLDRDRCAACFACVEECYSTALEVIGKERSVAEVLDEVEKDRPFYDESGGGMTLGGGEPLQQFRFTEALLRGAKDRRLHTCLETSGLGPQGRLADLIPVVDLFLFDFKETDPDRHRACTGYSNDLILDNLRHLDRQGAVLILRCPIVPGVNLRDDHLDGIASLAKSLRNCQAVHIMGYHALGESKRARLGLDAAETPFSTMRPQEVAAVVDQIRARGVPNVVSG